MPAHAQRSDRHRFNDLTVIKLAMELLARRTELSPYQQDLVQTACEATDRLTADLIEQYRAQRRVGDVTTHRVGESCN